MNAGAVVVNGYTFPFANCLSLAPSVLLQLVVCSRSGGSLIVVSMLLAYKICQQCCLSLLMLGICSSYFALLHVLHAEVDADILYIVVIVADCRHMLKWRSRSVTRTYRCR